jgi:hypothetical protein
MQPGVVKRAPAKKAPVRPPITLRLLPNVLKHIERTATKQGQGARKFLQEYLEDRFNPTT